MAKKYNKPIIAVQPWGAERTSSIVKNASDVIVGWNGQEAVVGSVGGSKKTISILVRPGVYEEHVSMPESSPRIELVKQTGAEIRDNGFTQDVYVAPYKGDRVCAISYTFDKNRGRYMY